MENKNTENLDNMIIKVVVLMLESTLGSMSARQADEIVYKAKEILKTLL